MEAASEVVFHEAVEKAIQLFDTKEWRSCLSTIGRARAQLGSDTIGTEMDSRADLALARLAEMEAECLSATGRHEDAIARAQENCSAYPLRVEGPYILGRVLHRAQRLVEAKQALGKAFALNPRATQVRVALHAVETDIRLQKSKAAAIDSPTWAATVNSRASTPRLPPALAGTSLPPQAVPPLNMNRIPIAAASPRSSHQTPRDWLMHRAEAQRTASVNEIAGELATHLLAELRKEELSAKHNPTLKDRVAAPMAVLSVFVVCCLAHLMAEDGDFPRAPFPLSLITSILMSTAVTLGLLHMHNRGTLPRLLDSFVSASRSGGGGDATTFAANGIEAAARRIQNGVANATAMASTPRHFDSYGAANGRR